MNKFNNSKASELDSRKSIKLSMSQKGKEPLLRKLVKKDSENIFKEKEYHCEDEEA